MTLHTFCNMILWPCSLAVPVIYCLWPCSLAVPILVQKIASTSIYDTIMSPEYFEKKEAMFALKIDNYQMCRSRVWQ